MVLVWLGGGHGGLDLMIPVVSVFSPPNVAALMQAQRGLKNLLGVAEPDWIPGPLNFLFCARDMIGDNQTFDAGTWGA